MEITGKSAVVTGAGSGIGRGIALALAKTGANVVLADIERERAQEVAAEVAALGVRSMAAQCDVTSVESVEALAETAWREFGPIELLFNNAGVYAGGPGLELSVREMQWLFEVNVFGVMYGCAAFGRRLLQQDLKGWICNTSSELGLGMSGAAAALYTGTKHAVVGITDVLRFEYQGRIGFSVLCPAAVNTGIWNAGRNRPEKHGGKADSNLIAQRAMKYGLDALEVGALTVQGVRNEEFFIITHPHDRALAERRWLDVSEAIDRQWPNGPGPQHHSSEEIQRRVIKELSLEAGGVRS